VGRPQVLEREGARPDDVVGAPGAAADRRCQGRVSGSHSRDGRLQTGARLQGRAHLELGRYRAPQLPRVMARTRTSSPAGGPCPGASPVAGGHSRMAADTALTRDQLRLLGARQRRRGGRLHAQGSWGRPTPAGSDPAEAIWTAIAAAGWSAPTIWRLRDRCDGALAERIPPRNPDLPSPVGFLNDSRGVIATAQRVWPTQLV